MAAALAGAGGVMPGGTCSLCGQDVHKHADDCARTRGGGRTRTSGAKGQRLHDAMNTLSVKQTKARLRPLIERANSALMSYVLTRYQASTGVLVLGHSQTRAYLDKQRKEMETAARRLYPEPDGATYDVVPRSTLTLILKKATDDEWPDESDKSISPTNSASVSTGK